LISYNQVLNSKLKSLFYNIVWCIELCVIPVRLRHCSYGITVSICICIDAAHSPSSYLALQMYFCILVRMQKGKRSNENAH